MTQEQLNRVFHAVFLFFLMFLPFELPIAEGVHGLCAPLIGEAYPVLFISSLLSLVSLLLLLTTRASFADKVMGNYLFLCLAYLGIGCFALLVTTVCDGYIDLAVKQLAFGYLTPVIVCAYILSLERGAQQTAWFSLYLGWTLYLLISMFFLVYYWQVGLAQDAGFSGSSFGRRLFLWRYLLASDWNLYPLFIGNANKTSNHLIVFLLLSVKLIGNEQLLLSRFKKMVFHLFWLLSVVTIVVLFSRAALLLLPVVVYASGVWRFINKKLSYSVGALLISTSFIAYSSYADVINYLLFSKISKSSDSDALGSLSSRFDQWAGIHEHFSERLYKLVFGMGTGGYGYNFHGEVNVGTHNMFLDTLMEGGVVNLLLLLVLVFSMLLLSFDASRLKIVDKTTFATIVSLILLMNREHSVSYLYVTSLGGFCFVMLFYLLSNSKGKSPSGAFASPREPSVGI